MDLIFFLASYAVTLGLLGGVAVTAVNGRGPVAVLETGCAPVVLLVGVAEGIGPGFEVIVADGT